MASGKYSKMTKAELVVLAKKKKAAVSSSMTKDQLIKAVEGATSAKKAATKKTAAKKKPTAKKPATKKSVAKKKTVNKAAAKKTGAQKSSATKKTVAKKAAVKKKTAKKAAAKKTAVKKKPAAKKAPAKKSVTKKRAVNKTVTKTAVAEKAAAKKTRRSWDIPADAGKFFVPSDVVDLPGSGADELPEEYGDNSIVAIPRDPHTIYLYWDLQVTAVENAQAALDKEWSRITWTLRAFDVTGADFDVERSTDYFDVTVDPAAKKYFLSGGKSEHEYVVAIGLADDTGRFVPLCVSNRVVMPPSSVSSSGGSEEGLKLLYETSGGAIPGSLMGEEMSSPGALGLEVSSFGASELAPQPEARRDFFLWVNSEVTVYGQTVPGSRVTIQGLDVPLRPDGTFSTRVHLPDGTLDLPVVATSPDGKETKEISLTVSRSSRVVR